MSVAFSVVGTLAGCIGSMTCVEALAKQQASSMNLLTFGFFTFIALEGLIVTSRFFTVKNKIPILAYLPVVSVFFFANVTNNQALNFHVPVPLHIIFRSGALLTNLVMNRFVVGKKYSLKKYLSVILITVGIIVCTLADSASNKAQALHFEDAEKHYQEWMIGIVLLVLALLATSYLAIVQENLYTKYGKHPREAMFFIHFLSLPVFILFGNDIYNNIIIFSQSSPYTALGINTGIPNLWLKLLGASIGQWVCIRFVYMLSSQVDSLTVTLVVTLRKFLSLLVSIFWFGSVFTALHWVGALMVFGGTLTFSLKDEKPAEKKE